MHQFRWTQTNTHNTKIITDTKGLIKPIKSQDDQDQHFPFPHEKPTHFLRKASLPPIRGIVITNDTHAHILFDHRLRISRTFFSRGDSTAWKEKLPHFARTLLTFQSLGRKIANDTFIFFARFSTRFVAGSILKNYFFSRSQTCLTRRVKVTRSFFMSWVIRSFENVVDVFIECDFFSLIDAKINIRLVKDYLDSWLSLNPFSGLYNIIRKKLFSIFGTRIQKCSTFITYDSSKNIKISMCFIISVTIILCREIFDIVLNSFIKIGSHFGNENMTEIRI